MTDRRMELYKEGLNDSQIARIVGVSQSVITNWRNQRKLPANRRKGAEYTIKDADGNTIAQGTQREIAQQLSMSVSAVCQILQGLTKGWIAELEREVAG